MEKVMKNSKQLLILVPIFVLLGAFATIGIGHLLHPSWVGEQGENAGYLQKSFGLITDAPHATAELFYSTLENVIILIVGFSWGRYRWRQEHKKFDQEHNIEHE
jgi:hypothetical protein